MAWPFAVTGHRLAPRTIYAPLRRRLPHRRPSGNSSGVCRVGVQLDFVCGPVAGPLLRHPIRLLRMMRGERMTHKRPPVEAGWKSRPALLSRVAGKAQCAERYPSTRNRNHSWSYCNAPLMKPALGLFSVIFQTANNLAWVEFSSPAKHMGNRRFPNMAASRGAPATAAGCGSDIRSGEVAMQHAALQLDSRSGALLLSGLA